MVQQAGLRLPLDQRHPQRRHGQLPFQRSAQRPADHAPGKGVEDHRQVDKFGAQSDVGDVGHPKLVDRGGSDAARQVRVDGQVVA
jgi:hypothetical protein